MTSLWKASDSGIGTRHHSMRPTSSTFNPAGARDSAIAPEQMIGPQAIDVTEFFEVLL
jgi:hypothetical protein